MEDLEKEPIIVHSYSTKLFEGNHGIWIFVYCDTCFTGNNRWPIAEQSGYKTINDALLFASAIMQSHDDEKRKQLSCKHQYRMTPWKREVCELCYLVKK